MALKVGITGGIGSGKSVVCDIFRLLGVPIFNSDLESREILQSDALVRAGVKEIFGPQAYAMDGTPDRKFIASLAFSDKSKLAKLNALIHPAVNKRFEDWCVEHSESDYVIKEAAILIESGAYKQLDCVVVVNAPEALRFKRASERDHLTTEEIIRRSKNQLPESELNTYADYKIQNDEAVLLIPQVMKLHSILKERAHKKS